MIDVKEVVHGVVADVNVGLAVAVDVKRDDAQTLAGFRAARRQPRLIGHVAKGSVAACWRTSCAQPLNRSADRRRGSAYRLRPRTVVACRIIVPRPIDVLIDVQIGKAVAVKVGPGGAGGPLNPGRGRTFLSRPQTCGPLPDRFCPLARCGTRPRGPSRSRAGRASRRGRNRPLRRRACRSQGKSSRPTSLVTSWNLKPPRLRYSLHGRPTMVLSVGAVVSAAARHENIEQSVAVVVDQGHAAAQRFEDGQVAGLFAVAVGEVDARIFDLLEKGRQHRVNIRRRRIDNHVRRGGGFATDQEREDAGKE